MKRSELRKMIEEEVEILTEAKGSPLTKALLKDVEVWPVSVKISARTPHVRGVGGEIKGTFVLSIDAFMKAGRGLPTVAKSLQRVINAKHSHPKRSVVQKTGGYHKWVPVVGGKFIKKFKMTDSKSGPGSPESFSVVFTLKSEEELDNLYASLKK